MVVPLVGGLISFLIALLIGGLAIYISARVVVDVDDYSHAVVTAIIGVGAWLSALLILLLVNTVLGLGINAFGVPGI